MVVEKQGFVVDRSEDEVNHGLQLPAVIQVPAAELESCIDGAPVSNQPQLQKCIALLLRDEAPLTMKMLSARVATAYQIRTRAAQSPVSKAVAVLLQEGDLFENEGFLIADGAEPQPRKVNKQQTDIADIYPPFIRSLLEQLFSGSSTSLHIDELYSSVLDAVGLNKGPKRERDFEAFIQREVMAGRLQRRGAMLSRASD